MPKLLLFRGSPRSDIGEVEKYNDKMPCDVLCMRYMSELPAYSWARKYFLEHDYDYFVIATDDIIVKPEHIRQLNEDLEHIDLPVLSGMMNVDEKDYPDGFQNISYHLALQDRKLRFYNWLTPKELPDNDIFRVKFAGFGLTAIKRDIMQQYYFAADGYIRWPDDPASIKRGASLDLVFAYDCQENDIPQYCDKRIKMKHLRSHGTIRIGEKHTAAELYKNGKKTIIARPENTFVYP